MVLVLLLLLLVVVAISMTRFVRLDHLRAHVLLLLEYLRRRIVRRAAEEPQPAVIRAHLPRVKRAVVARRCCGAVLLLRGAGVVVYTWHATVRVCQWAWGVRRACCCYAVLLLCYAVVVLRCCCVHVVGESKVSEQDAIVLVEQEIVELQVAVHLRPRAGLIKHLLEQIVNLLTKRLSSFGSRCTCGQVRINDEVTWVT